MEKQWHHLTTEERKEHIRKSKQKVSESPSVTGYGARPLEVIEGMAIILNQGREECKECKWHPDACQHCKVNHLENLEIEKEMAP